MMRILILAMGLLLGFSSGYYLVFATQGSQPSTGVAATTNQPSATDALPERPGDLLGPNEKYSPRDVVEMQIEAIANYQQNRVSIHQVFVHASPSNQAVTGPLARFEQLFWQAPYDALIRSRHTTIGQSVERDDVATILVTTIDANNHMSVFRFLLSRQSGKHEGCWMTDAVFCLVNQWQTGDVLPTQELEDLSPI